MREKWLKVNLYSEVNKPKISRIIQIESEITDAVMNGHKCHLGDIFRDKRNEMLRLRAEIISSTDR
jgi:hypothetical protein